MSIRRMTRGALPILAIAAVLGSARRSAADIVEVGTPTDTPPFFSIEWKVTLNGPINGASDTFTGTWWTATITEGHFEASTITAQHLKPIDGFDGGGPGTMVTFSTDAIIVVPFPVTMSVPHGSHSDLYTLTTASGGNTGGSTPFPIVLITLTGQHVPEPASMALLAAGAGGLLALGYRNRLRTRARPPARSA